MTNEMIDILICDDHALIREGLAKIIELYDGYQVKEKLENGQELLDYLKKDSADVILLDINMPVINGIETLKAIRKRSKKMKIIMLTVYDDHEYLVEAMNLGVNGYLLKDTETDHLMKAIQIVDDGGSYIDPSLAGSLFKEMNDKKKKKKPLEELDSLTKREYEVLLQIADGKSNRGISELLKISEKTVKNHVSSILRKMDFQDRTQAAIYVIKNNLKK